MYTSGDTPFCDSERPAGPLGPTFQIVAGCCGDNNRGISSRFITIEGFYQDLTVRKTGDGG